MTLFMEKENLRGRTVRYIMDNLKMDFYMDMVFIIGLTVEYIKDNGNKIK